jgi:hypothetical protein
MHTLQPIDFEGVMVIVSKITIKKTQHSYPYSWSSRWNLGFEAQHKGTLLEECLQKYISCKRQQRRLILITTILDDLGTSIITIQAQCNKKYYLPLKRNNNRNNNCNFIFKENKIN